MKLEIASFQAVAANLVAEGEVCDLANETPSTQTETETRGSRLSFQNSEPGRLKKSIG